MEHDAHTLLSYLPPTGSGSPLLLLHGWGATFAIWQDLESLLKQHFQLIMVELPGFGGSRAASVTNPYYETCADEIERVRQALGIETWAIFGYSIGACAGEAYGRRYPQHVTQIVALCPAYLRASLLSGLRMAIALEHRWPRFMDWLLSNPRWQIMVSSGLRISSGFGERNRRATRILVEELQRQPPESLKQALRALVDLAAIAPHPPGNASLLCLWGRRDPLIPRPRPARPFDIAIPSNHNAPLLVAPQIAEHVIRFLHDGKVVAVPPAGARSPR